MLLLPVRYFALGHFYQRHVRLLVELCMDVPRLATQAESIHDRHAYIANDDRETVKSRLLINRCTSFLLNFFFN